jgi:SAM-dependent methyltransferase
MRFLDALTDIESRWFDFSRGVETDRPTALHHLSLAGRAEDGQSYAAARPGGIRMALRGLPIKDFSAFTFVDLGSGKGRALMIAAEYKFRRILGIEFARELHEAAERNLTAWKKRYRPGMDVESVHADALDYHFPEEPLVIYYFNSFAPAAAAKVLTRLGTSLAEKPREVYVIYMFPKSPEVFERATFLTAWKKVRRYHIYEAVNR